MELAVIIETRHRGIIYIVYMIIFYVVDQLEETVKLKTAYIRRGRWKANSRCAQIRTTVARALITLTRAILLL